MAARVNSWHLFPHSNRHTENHAEYMCARTAAPFQPDLYARRLNSLQVQITGMIRNSTRLNYHEIFFDRDSFRRGHEAAGHRGIRLRQGK